jgi:hypothetical protein
VGQTKGEERGQRVAGDGMQLTNVDGRADREHAMSRIEALIERGRTAPKPVGVEVTWRVDEAVVVQGRGGLRARTEPGMFL